MGKPNPPRCGAELRDGSGCLAAGLKDWNGRCLHHGAIELGAELGWVVRGSRKAGVWVAQRDGAAHIADSPRELLDRIKAAV